MPGPIGETGSSTPYCSSSCLKTKTYGVTQNVDQFVFPFLATEEDYEALDPLTNDNIY